MNYVYVNSPIGKLLIAGDDSAIRLISFPNRAEVEPGWIATSTGVLDNAARQLREYFDGRRVEFDLPLAPEGTAFQRDVWQKLCEIPYGSTISYGELARRVGNPKASRAVGAANGQNPIPIVIPCHRVIGSNGSLTGFGGGIDMKRRLLDFEAGFRTL